MQTRLYSDLIALIQAMLGGSLAIAEIARLKMLINRRLQKAYRASNYWPRYLVIGEARTVASGIIGYTQASLSSIDTFLRIYVADPLVNPGSQEYSFTVTSAGARLIYDNTAPTSAYVTYKAQAAVVYGDGPGETSDVPYEFFNYIAQGVYSDWLKGEGLQDRAAIADQEANEILQDELMRIDEQHTQTIIANRVGTHTNMQTR